MELARLYSDRLIRLFHLIILFWYRWRKLEGKDPPTLELIQKIQSLQKRLISRNEEIVDRELSLQEKDKQVAELRANLARQPGPDVIDDARSLKVSYFKKSFIYLFFD